jgi:hypothetical protein
MAGGTPLDPMRATPVGAAVASPVGFSLPDREEFIARQAAFQFGACSAPRGLPVAELAAREAVRRPSLAFHSFDKGSFVPAERGAHLRKGEDGRWCTQFGDDPLPLGKKVKAGRKAEVLSDLYGLGLSGSVMLDMNDAVWEPNAFPTFQYNRAAGAENAILWPLRRVHEIGQKDFCSPPDIGEPPFGRKEKRLIWRGSLRGFSTHGGAPRNIAGVTKAHLAGRISKEDLLKHLATVPRYAFVSRYFGVEGFDVGFTPARERGYMWEIPEIARFEKERAPQSEQLACKYQISIQGTDVGSSFGWQLGSKCVILKENYPWEVFFDCHFRPWVHFVPVETGFADVTEKIAWCESHPEKCEAMIAARHAVVGLLLDSRARREAFARVVARYNNFYARWSAKSLTETV